jgi:hypothetical protein
MKHKYFVTAVVMLFFFSLLLSGGGKMEKIDRDKILQTGKEWQYMYDKYEPDETFIETLEAKLGKNLKIDVYLALWCPDSRNNVPKFIKILDRLETKVPVNYYTVPRKPGKDVKYFIEDLKVERVPTFIFYRDGKEIGRIIENPQKSLVEDFLEIIF